MKSGDRASVRPTVESLEDRTLFATTGISPAFVIAGTGKNALGGPDVARVLRINGSTGATTVVAQFARLGFNSPAPLLDRIDDVALAPDGTLVLVGTGDDPSGLAGGDVVKVVRINPATSGATPVTQFTPPGGIQPLPPQLNQGFGVAVAPDGAIYVAGTGIVNLGDAAASVRVFRVAPAGGTPRKWFTTPER